MTTGSGSRAPGDDPVTTRVAVTEPGPLKVVLVWTDPPSSSLATSNLVNDLDLVVRGPGGRFLGNSFSAESRSRVARRPAQQRRGRLSPGCREGRVGHRGRTPRRARARSGLRPRHHRTRSSRRRPEIPNRTSLSLRPAGPVSIGRPAHDANPDPVATDRVAWMPAPVRPPNHLRPPAAREARR